MPPESEHGANHHARPVVAAHQIVFQPPALLQPPNVTAEQSSAWSSTVSLLAADSGGSWGRDSISLQ